MKCGIPYKMVVFLLFFVLLTPAASHCGALSEIIEGLGKRTAEAGEAAGKGRGKIEADVAANAALANRVLTAPSMQLYLKGLNDSFAEIDRQMRLQATEKLQELETTFRITGINPPSLIQLRQLFDEYANVSADMYKKRAFIQQYEALKNSNPTAAAALASEYERQTGETLGQLYKDASFDNPKLQESNDAITNAIGIALTDKTYRLIDTQMKEILTAQYAKVTTFLTQMKSLATTADEQAAIEAFSQVAANVKDGIEEAAVQLAQARAALQAAKTAVEQAPAQAKVAAAEQALATAQQKGFIALAKAKTAPLINFIQKYEFQIEAIAGTSAIAGALVGGIIIAVLFGKKLDQVGRIPMSKSIQILRDDLQKNCYDIRTLTPAQLQQLVTLIQEDSLDVDLPAAQIPGVLQEAGISLPMLTPLPGTTTCNAATASPITVSMLETALTVAGYSFAGWTAIDMQTLANYLGTQYGYGSTTKLTADLMHTAIGGTTQKDLINTLLKAYQQINATPGPKSVVYGMTAAQ